jgi:tetratricopeptide (TPR) repeat protein
MHYAHWLMAALVVLVLAVLLGSAGGVVYGQVRAGIARRDQLNVELAVQMNLAQVDMDAGRYYLARQRYEYVIEQDPDYPGVQGKLVEALVGQAESLTTLPTAAAEPTPTPDTRAADELYAAAQAHLANQDWRSLLDTLVALRTADPYYETVQVDRMLNLALRKRGADRILNEGNLEGGLYDLALAESFAPMDTQSGVWREWARLYLLGASFWNVDPGQAVSTFSQLILSAPYLRDQSGLTVTDRYRLALIQYGDKLAAADEWCEAQVQYEAALSMSGAGSEAELKAKQAAEQCANPSGTATATPETTPTFTQTGQLTQVTGETPTATNTPDPAIQTPTATATMPVVTSSPTVEVTPTPTATVESPTLTPAAQETTPAATD